VWKGVTIIDLDEEVKLPFVPLHLIEYLKKTYGLEYVLNVQFCSNNDEHIGYMRGVHEVITKLDSIAKRGDNV